MFLTPRAASPASPAMMDSNSLDKTNLSPLLAVSVRYWSDSKAKVTDTELLMTYLGFLHLP